MPPKQDFILAMSRHLPPSAAELRLLDVGGETGDGLIRLRADLTVQTASLNVSEWACLPDSMDAITAYDTDLSADFLTAALIALRPGGRLIIINPAGSVDESPVRTLENAGYTRILVEAAFENAGVLIRGEKPHVTTDTLARVQIAAGRDSAALTLETFRGRYVHLLIQQTPNKPAWRLVPGEQLQWRAVSLADTGTLLAFSSLPKAVRFLQTAVLQNTLQDIHKIAKFSMETARGWTHALALNPAPEILQHLKISFVEIDPATAETGDE